MSLSVSVVIPTCKRPADLAACLTAILEQSTPPLEVIVVDNDAQHGAQATLALHAAQCAAQHIGLFYAASPKNSLPCARNLGVQLAQGDIVQFLDDDVVLDPDYLSEILKVYAAKSTALGVEGLTANLQEKPGFWRRILFQSNTGPGAHRALPSIRTIYPLAPSALVPCECLGGCNASYRRAILAEYPGDENLLKYAFGEDFDQSYRIFQRHPGTLWLTPFARCTHKVSQAGRAAGKERVYVTEVYGLYLFFKLFPHTPKNTAIYWWSCFGRILEKVAHLSPRKSAELRDLLGALSFCRRHLPEIKAGDLAFFNRTLTAPNA